MGDMFRSEKMSLCHFYIQPEAAYKTVCLLGELGNVQFRDKNEALLGFQRKFISEVRRCDELERRMAYIRSEIELDGIKMRDIVENFPEAPNPKDVVEFENILEKTEMEVLELSQNTVKLKSNRLELIEMSEVLAKAETFFNEQELIVRETEKHPDTQGRLGFLAGVLNRSHAFAFERMLWRIARGNIYLKHGDLDEAITDPKTGTRLYKTVFVIFYQGQQLQSRLRKICEGFHASLYPCPGTHEERVDMLRGVKTRIEDLKSVLAQTEDYRAMVLALASKNLPTWSVMVTKMKAAYHTLNMMNVDASNNCLIGEGWIPTRDLASVQQALEEGSAAAGSTVKSFMYLVETRRKPPTYNRVNRFTAGFQALIDAYGMANYREVNPALYTIITFPFLFAVMFGDLGHGTILMLLGLWMVLWEKSLMLKKGGEIWRIFFGGRYIILLLGVFSMYTGFTYNDTFSKSINVFGSKWRVNYNTTTVLTNDNLQLNPTTDMIAVYPIGLDPIWQLAENKIIFMNTYKMKLSIIFGVLHMAFGLCFAVENFVYFKKYALIILEFVPEMIFLLLLFGYMCFMMFYKWVKYSPHATYLPDTPGCAPSVLIYFIHMLLFHASTAPKGCEIYMFDAQSTMQHAFVVVALICIPWILLGKPLYIKFLRAAEEKRKSEIVIVEVRAEKVETSNGETIFETETEAVIEDDCDEEEEEPMSEIWIHQGIHTIEYILSTISHTASYLRLWALSLAHAELSDVLWIMVMTIGLHLKGYAGAIGLYFIFWAWALLTIAIMIMMEGLSAFLHTLRLHWVEFMSKFYTGAGYAFTPFSFHTILSSYDED